ncbi:TorF family putative porin [Duganella sp. Leaf126]|uniref:TorF family putative porin n=1 Tax=Duganella sp. Leaf126 TaxID=1736266 RepID=UPI000A7C0331|nr:TorF family putative porin [Duganella sp. Leaf126]
MTRRRPACQALAPLLLMQSMLLAPGPALAQLDVTGSVAVQSEYRYRGQNPGEYGLTPQATINVDTDRGWYGGGFASAITVGDVRGYKLQGYAGYARRLQSGGSWELGCSHINYTQAHENNFNECYAGLSFERGSTRLYYAPRYLGYDARVLYGEINAFYPVHPRFNLVGHLGLLHNLSGGFFPGIPDAWRYDARIGVGIPFGRATLQLAREHVQDDGRRYTMYPVHPPRRWSWGLSYAF